MEYEKLQRLSRILEDVKANPDRFSWGKITNFHKVGHYDIIEFNPWKVKNNACLVGEPDETLTQFACYIDGKTLSQSTTTLDSALALCIAYNIEGANHRADYYFIKALETIKDEVNA